MHIPSVFRFVLPQPRHLAFLLLSSCVWAAATPSPAAVPAATVPADRATAVALGPCCQAAKPGPLLPSGPSAGISVARDGTALPAGHVEDVYYAGLAPSGRTAPKAYRFWSIRKPLQIDFKRHHAGLTSVRFHAYHGHGRTLTPASEASMAALLHRLLGADLRLSRLGQGGHQVVWKACTAVAAATQPGVPTRPRCFVAKVRKLQQGHDAATRAALATQAAIGLQRDLTLFRIADEVTARGHLRDAKGQPLPMRVNGKLTVPRTPPAGPPGRIARIARLLRPAALEDGVLVQQLVSFRPSSALRTMLHGLEGPDGALRDKAWTNAPKFGINRVRVLGFLDQYNHVTRIGPDVIRLSAFMQDCAALERLPTVGAFCRQVRADFSVPDDFLSRVAALEQLYRDSAGAVIRFHRANFREAVGNTGVDGKTREVGLDYNHGRNVGWDPETMQFVLFDA